MAALRNILIFHLGALGDFVVTWPLAVALARLHPQSRVFYVSTAQKGALAEKALRVESLDIDAGGWHRLYSDAPDLPAPSARALAGAHTIVSFVSRPDDRWSANVGRANPQAALLSISTAAPDDFAGHQAQFLVDQLGPWPAAAATARQILSSLAERGLNLWTAENGPIVMHPGGGADRKCWDADCYLALARSLAAAGQRVRVLLGEVELERWPAQRIAAFRDVAEVATPTTLIDLLAEAQKAKLFIGNDSGPGHLAGMVGAPTLSLFGAGSRPDRWRPLGPRVRVIHQPLETLEPPAVLSEVRAMASLA